MLKCHLNRRNWVKTTRLFPSKIFEKYAKTHVLIEPIIRRLKNQHSKNFSENMTNLPMATPKAEKC